MFGGTFGNLYSRYESKSVVIAANTTDYNMREQASLFGILNEAAVVIIRTNQTIDVKFNSESSDAINVTSSESPFIRNVAISDLFITTGGSGATVKVEIYMI